MGARLRTGRQRSRGHWQPVRDEPGLPAAQARRRRGVARPQEDGHDSAVLQGRPMAGNRLPLNRHTTGHERRTYIAGGDAAQGRAAGADCWRRCGDDAAGGGDGGRAQGAQLLRQDGNQGAGRRGEHERVCVPALLRVHRHLWVGRRPGDGGGVQGCVSGGGADGCAVYRAAGGGHAADLSRWNTGQWAGHFVEGSAARRRGTGRRVAYGQVQGLLAVSCV